MTELVAGVPPLLASHLGLVLTALVVAIAISLPLAVIVARRPRFAVALLGGASVIQTIPGLALLALMVPLIDETAGLGLGLSAFGFPPAVIALTLYAILPILRNAVTGLRGVDPAVVEAARGMGMAPRQLLRQVELPLAAPVIAAGIRTATVWTVGAATLATPVGQPSLGNYIFTGLQTRNWAMLLTGVAAAALLAMLLDAILAAAERALASRHRRRVLWPAGALIGLAIVVFALPWVTAARTSEASGVTTAATTTPAVRRLRIGAKTFTEQYVLAEVLRARLAQVGITAELVESLGSAVAFDALTRGEIDAYVDYSGTIWTQHMRRAAGPPRWQVLAEVEGWLAREHGVRSLGSLGFENAYVLAVRRDTAARLALGQLGDLAPHAPALTLGADYEFLGRGEWRHVRAAYRLRFAREVSFDPTLLYEALAAGEVDAISAFSSDGRIAAYDLVTLDDPAGALPPYDAMILLGPRVAGDPGVTCALAGLRDAIPVARMREANHRVDRTADKQTPRAAAAWLLDGSAPPGACPPATSPR